MRIQSEISEFFQNAAEKLGYNAEAYLFGSRADDLKKGGDIDILILADKKFEWKELLKIEVDFEKIFGEQKLDLISYAKNDHNNFKEMILKKAVKL